MVANYLAQVDPYFKQVRNTLLRMQKWNADHGLNASESVVDLGFASRCWDSRRCPCVFRAKVKALKTQQQDPAAAELSFQERLAMLVDQQWNWRENQALTG